MKDKNKHFLDYNYLRKNTLKEKKIAKLIQNYYFIEKNINFF